MLREARTENKSHIWSAQDVFRLVEKVHQYPENLYDDGNLGERIYKHDTYTLEQVPISNFDLKEWAVYDEHVDEILQQHKDDLLVGNYPPIVAHHYLSSWVEQEMLGNPEEHWSVVDGMHRLNALHKLGVTTAKVLVGRNTAELSVDDDPDS